MAAHPARLEHLFNREIVNGHRRKWAGNVPQIRMLQFVDRRPRGQDRVFRLVLGKKMGRLDMQFHEILIGKVVLGRNLVGRIKKERENKEDHDHRHRPFPAEDTPSQG